MLDNLYENIGSKIKNWAKWIFVIEAIGAVIAGQVLLFTDEDLILYGLLAAICGPIVAYVSSWILYAFGELVEDVHAIRNKEGTTEEAKRKAEEAKRKAKEKATLSAMVFFCSKCNQTFIGSKCNQTFIGRDCKESDRPECPNCKKKTYSTGITKGEWVQMTKEERQNKLQEITENSKKSKTKKY